MVGCGVLRIMIGVVRFSLSCEVKVIFVSIDVGVGRVWVVWLMEVNFCKCCEYSLVKDVDRLRVKVM